MSIKVIEDIKDIDSSIIYVSTTELAKRTGLTRNGIVIDIKKGNFDGIKWKSQYFLFPESADHPLERPLPFVVRHGAIVSCLQTEN